MGLPAIPTRHQDSSAHRQRISEVVNGVTSFQFDDSRVKTQAEIAAGVPPVNQAFDPVPQDVRRQGAVDGEADSTAAIQRAINAVGNQATVPGGQVLLPGDANSVWNLSTTLSIPKRVTATDNHDHWYSLKGMGRGAPRLKAITGLASKPMIDASGNSTGPVGNFYREIKDLYLAGNSIAEVGVDIRIAQHYKIENLFINGLKKGAGAYAAGIATDLAICSQFRDIKVHNSEGYGINVPGGSGSFFNANLVEGCSFLALGIAGFYSSGGVSGNTFIANTFESCASYGARFSGFSTGGNFMGGNYFELNNLGDILIGEDNPMDHFVMVGNYLNGYSAGSSSNNYSPIRVQGANYCYFGYNNINSTVTSPSGAHVFEAIAGGTITNTVVEGCSCPGLAATARPASLYILPANWVDNGNAVKDPQFMPLIQNNIFRRRFPFGGWSIGATGATTIARIAGSIMGAPGIRMTHVNLAETCNINITVNTSDFPEFKNRYVTFAVPVLGIVSSKTVKVQAVPLDGTNFITGTVTHNDIGTSLRIVYVMCFVASNTTQVEFVVDAATDAGADFGIGHPCAYVGAQQWYSADGDEDFYDDSTPTTGTWARGDKVWKNSMAASTKMGVVCVTAGAPGTWKDMPSLGP